MSLLKDALKYMKDIFTPKEFPNLISIFDSIKQDLEFPIQRSDEGYLNQVLNIFKRFQNDVDSRKPLHPRDSEKNLVNSIYDTIRNVLDILKKCDNNGWKDEDSDAYAMLKTFLDEHKLELNCLCSIPQKGTASTMDSLYRVAVDEPKAVFDRRRLFHKPFELSSVGSDCRYNIKSKPCIYLGNSIDLCLKETRVPDDASYWAVQFRLNHSKTVRVLNFAYRWSEIFPFMFVKENEMEKINFVKSWLRFWPLMAACSIINNDDGCHQLYEYKLPQMLMKYISESELDGIRFYSTKKGGDVEWTKKNINIAFPAKGQKTSGYDDHLADIFELTEPRKFDFSTESVSVQVELEKLPFEKIS